MPVDLSQHPQHPQAVYFVLVGLAVGAYLLGGVPFGVLIGRMRGVDVRTSGSRNIGATNVGRLLGRRYFFLVLVLDALKAFVPAAAASVLVLTATTPEWRRPELYALWLLPPLAAFAGHMFSPFLGFRGGKGIACGLGMMLGTWPLLTLAGVVGLGVFVAVFKWTRYVSLGSVLAAIALPVAYLGWAWVFGWPVSRQWPIPVFLSAMAVLVLWKHRGNLRRLVAGTEPRADRTSRRGDDDVATEAGPLAGGGAGAGKNR